MVNHLTKSTSTSSLQMKISN